MQIVRLPYHLSAVSQAVARAALANSAQLLGQVEAIRSERDDTVTWLRGRGFEVADSDANFVLFGTFTDRHAVWQGLLEQGVLIRETGPDGWLRVSVGTPARDARVQNRAERDGRRTRVSRTGRVERQTSETKVLVEIDLDGRGVTDVSTGVGLLRPHADFLR